MAVAVRKKAEWNRGWKVEFSEFLSPCELLLDKSNVDKKSLKK